MFLHVLVRAWQADLGEEAAEVAWERGLDVEGFFADGVNERESVGVKSESRANGADGGRGVEVIAVDGFWEQPKVRAALLGRLPGYRLSKFQDCLPERYALEVVERYLLNISPVTA